MTTGVEILEEMSRRIRAEWERAEVDWTDSTASDFHRAHWEELEREAESIAASAAEMQTSVVRALRAIVS